MTPLRPSRPQWRLRATPGGRPCLRDETTTVPVAPLATARGPDAPPVKAAPLPRDWVPESHSRQSRAQWTHSLSKAPPSKQSPRNTNMYQEIGWIQGRPVGVGRRRPSPPSQEPTEGTLRELKRRTVRLQTRSPPSLPRLGPQGPRVRNRPSGPLSRPHPCSPGRHRLRSPLTDRINQRGEDALRNPVGPRG